MSKDLSAKYYQDKKERLQKNLLNNMEIFPKKETKSISMVMNNIEISQKMNNKG